MAEKPMKRSKRNQHHFADDLTVLPLEVIDLIARCLALLHDGDVFRSARLVCRHWNALVIRQADPRAWCHRLWTEDAVWPRDDRVFLSLPSSFLDVILYNENETFRHNCLGWTQFVKLAQRMLEQQMVEEDLYEMWSNVCIAMAAHVHVPLPYDGVKLVLFDRMVGLEALLHLSPAFCTHIKFAFLSENVVDSVGVAVQLLRCGVWFKRLDLPGLICGNNDKLEPNEMMCAWKLFIEQRMFDEPNVAGAINRVQDVDLIRMMHL